MSYYLKANQVKLCFERLSSRKSQGKTPMERTSALMYFLAFNSASKIIGEKILDLNPNKTIGLDNRKQIELEFTKFVLIKIENNDIFQVCELGKISRSKKSPEKRISSNFLTVPVKKASEQSKYYSYPRRPNTPLIKIGEAATGIKWGMAMDESWRESFPKLFSEISKPTYFTDLAAFIFKDFRFTVFSNNYIEAFSEALFERFTADLAEFWFDRIKKEQVLVKHLNEPFTSSYEPFHIDNLSSNKSNNNDIKYYIERVKYLEQVLDDNGIEYHKITRK